MATQKVKFTPPVFLNWQSMDSLEKVLISRGINNQTACVKFSSLQDSCVGEETENMCSDLGANSHQASVLRKTHRSSFWVLTVMMLITRVASNFVEHSRARYCSNLNISLTHRRPPRQVLLEFTDKEIEIRIFPKVVWLVNRSLTPNPETFTSKPKLSSA